jgi:hypothetical protein
MGGGFGDFLAKTCYSADEPLADIPRVAHPIRMVTVRFSNEHDQPIELMVEPWATIVNIAPGSTFAVLYPEPVGRPDTSFAEYHAGMIRFWCEGATFEVEVDEKIVQT